MTKNEAIKILRLCQKHKLPKPSIHPGRLDNNQYEVTWSTQQFKVTYRSFEASMQFITSMGWERG